MNARHLFLVYDEKLAAISGEHECVTGIYRDENGNELQATLAMETAEGVENYLQSCRPHEARLVYQGLVVHVANRARSGAEEKTECYNHIRAVGKVTSMSTSEILEKNKQGIFMCSNKAIKQREEDPRLTQEVDMYATYLVNGEEIRVTKIVYDQNALNEYRTQYPDAEIVYSGNAAKYNGFVRRDGSFVKPKN